MIYSVTDITEALNGMSVDNSTCVFLMEWYAIGS